MELHRQNRDGALTCHFRGVGERDTPPLNSASVTIRAGRPRIKEAQWPLLPEGDARRSAVTVQPVASALLANDREEV